MVYKCAFRSFLFTYEDAGEYFFSLFGFNFLTVLLLTFYLFGLFSQGQESRSLSESGDKYDILYFRFWALFRET